MWAVLAENEDVVHWMLDNKSLSIDRQAKDIHYRTALHLAAQIGALNIAKLLIKQGWALNDRDINNATPSHLAAGGGHTELIRCFQTALADKHELDAADRYVFGESRIDYLIELYLGPHYFMLAPEDNIRPLKS